MNTNNPQKNIPMKKEWKKPTLTTIKAAELTEYIKVAARSGSGGGACYALGR